MISAEPQQSPKEGVPSAPSKEGITSLRTSPSSEMKVRVLEYVRKYRWYWIRVFVLTAVGLLIGYKLGELQVWTSLRYSIYRFQTNMLRPPQPYALDVSFVMIGDGEYWTGAFERRAPLRRDSLATLLRAIDRAQPAVVALDVDFTVPIPDDSAGESDSYASESAILADAIQQISASHRVVLPVSVSAGKGLHSYRMNADIFSNITWKHPEHIARGYIQLPYDIREIPAELQVERSFGEALPSDPIPKGKVIQSFAQALITMKDPRFSEHTRHKDHQDLSFGSFLPVSEFTNSSFSAGQLMSNDENAINNIYSRVVIVCGSWSQFAYGVGPKIDQHYTPVGNISGAFVHANYMEALLTGHSYARAPEWLVAIIEVSLLLMAAAVFTLEVKTGLKITASAMPAILIAVFSYALLQNLGVFLEFFIPMVILALHIAADKVWEWRKEAKLASRSRH